MEAPLGGVPQPERSACGPRDAFKTQPILLGIAVTLAECCRQPATLVSGERTTAQNLNGWWPWITGSESEAGEQSARWERVQATEEAGVGPRRAHVGCLSLRARAGCPETEDSGMRTEEREEEEDERSVG